MLISADVKGLEVVCGAYLSRDTVLIDELLHGVDIHGANQKAFNFGEGKEGRLVAKRFKFKMIYGGTAGGFTNDPDFRFLKWNKKKWAKAIEDYYNKYQGIRAWHKELIDQVVYTGRYDSISGRFYDFSELLKEPDWFYIPKIKNYPVQGLGADVVQIARISLFRRMKEHSEFGKLVNTIHDSIIIDTPDDMCYNIISLVNEVFRDLPSNLSRLWGVDWDIPINVEFKTLDGKEIDINEQHHRNSDFRKP
jgi:DNA polymerase I-like protein with 3'-5' exonuclease and polymerase domains